MKRIDLIKARKLANILENLEMLNTVSDNISSSREPFEEIVINGYCIEIDRDELMRFVNEQINSKILDVELEFELDAR